jgi:hypothetical protein
MDVDFQDERWIWRTNPLIEPASQGRLAKVVYISKPSTRGTN